MLWDWEPLKSMLRNLEKFLLCELGWPWGWFQGRSTMLGMASSTWSHPVSSNAPMSLPPEVIPRHEWLWEKGGEEEEELWLQTSHQRQDQGILFRIKIKCATLMEALS